MEKTRKDTIKGRKVAILVEEGYNHNELMQIKDYLKNEGAYSEVISKTFSVCKSSDGKQVKPDKTFVTTASVVYDALFIPGGKHIELLKMQGDAIHFVNETFKHCKPLGATGEAIDLLKVTQISGVNLASTSDGNNVINHHGVVTLADPSDLVKFMEDFKNAVAQHRHWMREEKEFVPA